MPATKLLQQAFEEAAKLSAPEQDELAQWILDELSEREWQKRFDATGEQLDKLADEALREHRAGLSEPLSDTLQKMIDQARRDIDEGKTRPIEDLFEEDDGRR